METTTAMENMTENPIMSDLRSIVAQCLELLKLTTANPLYTEEDFASLANKNDSLTYCMAKIRKFPSATQPYILPNWQQILWTILFGTMVLVAIFGNSIVIWIVLAHRRMRSVTNFFLVNLSIADLLMAIFNTIFSFIYMLSSDWPFGKPYCIFSYFIGTLSVASSVFTITAISADRYMAIVKPLSPRVSKLTASGVIAIIWALSCLLSVPNILFSTTATYKYPDGTRRTICMLKWPDGKRNGESLFDYIYNIIIMMVTYVIPMLSLVVTYSWMVHVLWRSKGIGEVTPTQKNAVRSKQRAARMLTVVAALFAVCWLPYHAYFLFAYHVPEAINNPHGYVQQVYLAIYWLAMSNSMYNPIVYYFMNSRFRSYFCQILCCGMHTYGTLIPMPSSRGIRDLFRSLRGSTSEWSQRTTQTTIQPREHFLMLAGPSTVGSTQMRPSDTNIVLKAAAKKLREDTKV